MEKELTSRREEVSHKLESVSHHVEIGRDSTAPSIAVGLLFDERLLLDDLGSLVSNSHRDGEIGAHCERRVDVDQVDLAGGLLEEARHHELVGAPDELV